MDKILMYILVGVGIFLILSGVYFVEPWATTALFFFFGTVIIFLSIVLLERGKHAS